MKSKAACIFFLLPFVVFLTGCDLGLLNLTPSHFPQNPSSLYTFTTRVKINDSGLIAKSLKVYVVTNGEMHLMHPSMMGGNVFELDYQMPNNQPEADYYYYATYQTVINGKIHEKEIKTELFHLHLINRGVSSIETNRAPVGAQVAIVGKGFTRSDRVIIGGIEAPTHFISPHTIRFTVPPIGSSRTYSVEVTDGNKHLSVGSFRVDASTIQVSQRSISLKKGAKTLITLSIPHPAPMGGIPLDITTDIPDSLIIPELVLAEGMSSISMPIQASETGNGYIFIEAPGFRETSIAVTVVD
jgi:hypothetical protein